MYTIKSANDTLVNDEHYFHVILLREENVMQIRLGSRVGCVNVLSLSPASTSSSPRSSRRVGDDATLRILGNPNVYTMKQKLAPHT